jgi:hypothetical protein
MSKMIPPYISPDVKSNAEKKIFEWFRKCEGTEDWIVLHSLGVSKHINHVYGEIDFLVLAPHTGVFIIEVKGGRVKRQDGIWHFTDKYGNTTEKIKGPFEQASAGMFSIIEALRNKFGKDSPVSRITYGYGVMFPDIIFDDDSIDINKWQIFDKKDNLNIKDFIRRLSKHYSNQLIEKYKVSSKDTLPDNKTIKEVLQYLRGDFDKPIPFQVILNETETAQKILTSEQFGCLDALEDNPRCLIQGPAGTGKTILAIEDTIRSLSKADNVVLFCYNNHLGDYLKQFFIVNNNYGQPFFAGTFHSFMLKVIKDANIAIDKHDYQEEDFWDTTVPLLFLEAIKTNPVEMDKIIIDESQDLLKDGYLDIFDNILLKGFDRGNWSLYGDFSRQSLYTDLSYNSMIELLENRTSFINYKLYINCRNTFQICKEIQYITGFSGQRYSKNAINGMPVNYLTWRNENEQIDKIELLLERLLQKEKLKPETITILSSRRMEDSVVSKLKMQLRNYTLNPGNYLSFSTIQSFKGLENSVIILTDIDSYSDNKILYVGLSRARVVLYILESESAHMERSKLLLKVVEND